MGGQLSQLKQDFFHMHQIEREIGDIEMKVDLKAEQSDISMLMTRIERDYTPLKRFTLLHTTVVGKAEWMDVNDLIKDHRRTQQELTSVS